MDTQSGTTPKPEPAKPNPHMGSVDGFARPIHPMKQPKPTDSTITKLSEPVSDIPADKNVPEMPSNSASIKINKMSK